jgi:hypothetical protein
MKCLQCIGREWVLSQIVVSGITREAILIELNLSNINKEDGVFECCVFIPSRIGGGYTTPALQPFSRPTDEGTPSTACTSIGCLPS